MGKRICDIVISTIALLFLLPVFLLIALLIKIDSRGPVFFRQERIGKDGAPFEIWKFRTMIENARNMGTGLKTAENDFRITKVGSYLRRWSLDELPQLINVAKGEMSLVGPRPTVRSQVERYGDYERQRLQVKPGITGWAQVNGRNRLTWPERIDKDIWYIKNRSPLLDLKILFQTLFVIFKSEGLYKFKDRNQDSEKIES